MLPFREELNNHRHFRFGLWYENAGCKRYGHLAAFTEIEPAHSRMHAVGSEIIRLHEAGRLDLARTQISELLRLKVQVMQQLDVLQDAVARIACSKRRGPSDNLLLFKVRPTLRKK